MHDGDRNQQSASFDDYARAYAARDMRTGYPACGSAACDDAAGSAPGASGQVTYVAAPPRQPVSRALVAVVICVLGIALIASASCSATVTHMTDSVVTATDGSVPIQAATPSIAVVDMDSAIGYDGTASSPDGLRSRLDRAAADDQVKGVLLRVNSGGGTATAGEEMSKLVADFPKPIVVVSAATNASAAYEISSQADYIFCAKTTSIGAIGVYLQVTDLSGLYDKLGIEVDTITSTDSKDAGSGFRPLTDEERAWYQSMVDRIDEDFVQTVAEGRGMTIGEVKTLANGLPYTGSQAVEIGLADEIGYFDDALAYVSAQAGYDAPLPTITYEQSTSSLDALLDLLSSSESSASGAGATLPQQ